MKDLLLIFLLSATVATAGLLKSKTNDQHPGKVQSIQKYISFDQ